MNVQSRVRAIAAGLVILSVVPAHADWPSSPTTNLPICTTTGQQLVPSIATDMAGGTYIAWQDARIITDVNIYAQHVLASGAVDPGWPLNGLLVCGAIGGQSVPQVASDRGGGLLVAWNDARSGTNDIYAHHVLANGTVDPGWPANGLPVCTAVGSQSGVRLVSDSWGSTLLAWRDLRNDTDLYVMAIRTNGVVDPNWPVNGLALASGVGAQKFAAINPVVSDGAGGLFATWQDTRSGPDPDIYVQHLVVGGSVATGWPANGLAVCTSTNVQQFPSIARDHGGGVFVGWEDLRGGSGFDIYVQHVLASGVCDPVWPLDGRATCTAANNQYRITVLGDADGGAYAAWVDSRTGSIPSLYAQHLLANGTLDPAWPVGDLAFNLNFGSHLNLHMMPDGTGGALIVWDDGRSGLDVYAQHLLATGVDPAWPSSGRAVSAAANGQNASGAAIPDGSGGFIVTWSDARAGASGNDIYAQRVQANGQLGGAVVDVPREVDAPTVRLTASPNPWRAGALTVRCAPAVGPGATVEIVDVAGRVVVRRPMPGGGAGEVRFEPTERLAPGLYFVTLRDTGARELQTATIVAIP